MVNLNATIHHVTLSRTVIFLLVVERGRGRHASFGFERQNTAPISQYLDALEEVSQHYQYMAVVNLSAIRNTFLLMRGGQWWWW